ncbi:MAG: hypothetical protein WBE44_17255, partial [Terriglobales bacterium]
LKLHGKVSIPGVTRRKCGLWIGADTVNRKAKTSRPARTIRLAPFPPSQMGSRQRRSRHSFLLEHDSGI